MNNGNSKKSEIITQITFNYDFSIHQGDFIKNVNYIESAIENEGIIQISQITFPTVVVLTQECDAQQDFKNRKEQSGNTDTDKQHQYLLSVIVAPVYTADDLREGTHLSELGLKCDRITSDQYKQIKQNKNERYHFMKIRIGTSYLEYIVDFKHYFTVNTETILTLKKDEKNFNFQLDKLFKESVSQRFANYLSRIGLPEVLICE